jgi:hypothetical protein
MDIAGTLVNTFVVVAVGGFLTYVTLDRYRLLRAEIAAVRQELADGRRENKADNAALRQESKAELAAYRQESKTELADQRRETKAEFARLEARMDAGFNALRSEITTIALAVGAGAAATTREADPD